MTVNPFWFGVLMAIVGEIVLVLLFGIIRSALSSRDEETVTEEEYQMAMKEINGKRIKVIRENGTLSVELIEDEKDEKSN